MTKEIKSVQLDTSIDEAQRIMTENNIRHLPVVDQNHKLINFLSQRDLILSPTKKINQILMIGIPLLILITVFIIIK